MTNHVLTGRWLAAFAGGVSLIALAAPASAQDTTAGNSTSPAAQPDRDTAPPGGDPQVGEATNLGNEANESSNEVVVTATRRAQNLQDVPMSVDVATGEQIQRLNIFDAKDVAQLSPGLELTNTSGRNNNANLRGVESDQDTGAGATVDFYFNEVPIDIQTAFTAIYDIDQIEVLRGPQGALRGRTAPAGAITLRTRRPDFHKIGGYAQGTWTEDHAYNLQGGISVPIVNDRLAIRFSGLINRDRGNQVYNFNRNEWSRNKTESFRVSLGWKPTDNLNINLMYQYLHADNLQNSQYVSIRPFISDPRGGPDGRPFLDTDDRGSWDSEPRRFKNRTHLLTLNADWDLGPVTLQVVGGIQRTKLHSIIDQDGGNADAANIPGEPRLVQNLTVPYPIEMAEVRLLSNNEGGFWNWGIGAYYYHQAGDVTVSQISPFYIRFDPFFADRQENFVNLLIPVQSRTFAFTASSRFQFTEKLRLEGAVRWADTKGNQKQVGGVQLDPGSGCVDVEDPLDPTDFECFIDLGRENPSHENPVTGGANLLYEFSRNVTAYAAFARSYRGGTNAVSGPQFVTSDLLETDPETSNSFEIGLKTSFLDRRMSFNVAIFRQRYKNYISRVNGIIYNEGSAATGTTPDCENPVPGGQPVACGPGLTPDIDGRESFNYAGDLKVKGIEVTLSGRPTDNWDFSVSASYVKARYANAVLPCNDIDGDGQPDNSVPPGSEAITGGGNVSYCTFNGRPSTTPDFSVSANTEVRFPMGNVEPFVRALFTHRPGVTSVNGQRFKSRQLINLFAGVRLNDGKWELTGFVRNVLNQKRITGESLSESTAAVGAGGPDYTSGYRSVSVTNPREFGITAAFRF